eukprot:2866098-Rhodomonas_salina.1
MQRGRVCPVAPDSNTCPIERPGDSCTNERPRDSNWQQHTGRPLVLGAFLARRRREPASAHTLAYVKCVIGPHHPCVRSRKDQNTHASGFVTQCANHKDSVQLPAGPTKTPLQQPTHRAASERFRGDRGRHDDDVGAHCSGVKGQAAWTGGPASKPA